MSEFHEYLVNLRSGRILPPLLFTRTGSLAIFRSASPQKWVYQAKRKWSLITGGLVESLLAKRRPEARGRPLGPLALAKRVYKLSRAPRASQAPNAQAKLYRNDAKLIWLPKEKALDIKHCLGEGVGEGGKKIFHVSVHTKNFPRYQTRFLRAPTSVLNFKLYYFHHLGTKNIHW